MKFSGVTILQGVEFSIFLLISEWDLQQCSATALPMIVHPVMISQRELTFTSAICYSPSVCLSSVVCNARAPYSGGSNFRQYFYGIRYLGHPLTSTQNFTEIVPGELLRWGELNTTGVAKYSDFVTYRRLYLGTVQDRR